MPVSENDRELADEYRAAPGLAFYIINYAPATAVCQPGRPRDGFNDHIDEADVIGSIEGAAFGQRRRTTIVDSHRPRHQRPRSRRRPSTDAHLRVPAWTSMATSQADRRVHSEPTRRAVYAYRTKNSPRRDRCSGSSSEPGTFSKPSRSPAWQPADCVVVHRWRVRSRRLLHVTEPRIPCSNWCSLMGDAGGVRPSPPPPGRARPDDRRGRSSSAPPSRSRARAPRPTTTGSRSAWSNGLHGHPELRERLLTSPSSPRGGAAGPHGRATRIFGA